MIPYLKVLHLTIYWWREGREKDLYKTKSQPWVQLKVWEWEHDNQLEEKEQEALILDKYETAPEWIDPAPMLREDIVVLNRLTAQDNSAVTMC